MMNFVQYYARWAKFFGRRQPKPVRTARPRFECLEDRCVPATFTVTNNFDHGTGSLRQAIIDSNNHPAPTGANIINFELNTTNVIEPTSPLPTITASVNISALVNVFDQGVVLDGHAVGGTANGLTIDADGCTIEGLFIGGWGNDGILVNGSRNLIDYNQIGVNSFQVQGFGNGTGIVITGDDNTIGGDANLSQPNTIGANRYSGIVIDNGFGNHILGNNIGVDPNVGSPDVGNGGDGIKIEGPGSQENVIGGLVGTFYFNSISGNGGDGVAIIKGATDNTLEGNFIGQDGIYQFGNHGDGVYIGSGANGNYIGATASNLENHTTGVGNTIAGNGRYGVEITGKGTNLNFLIANQIGTDYTGATATPNALGGVLIHGGASYNSVGAPAAVEGNVISGNGGDGVTISGRGTTENVVVDNHIGTNMAGTKALPNQGVGVFIENRATDNTVGIPGGSQIIAGNTQEGVLISDGGTTGNKITGDRIGAPGMPNGFSGVAIDDGAANNTIGGTATNAGNTISANTDHGINITNPGTDGNTVEQNLITGNGGDGVVIQDDAAANYVGTSGSPNVISGNTDDGVALTGDTTTLNQVEYNLIGLNAAGTGAQGNGANGVEIFGGANNNTVDFNYISGNTLDGFHITGIGTDANIIRGNFIGTAQDQVTAVSNNYGIGITSGASGNLIGGDEQGNTIANNTHAGVAVTGDSSIDNTISQNSIYNNAIGIDLGNLGVIRANSPTSPSVGPNDLQNKPFLTVSTTPGIVNGTLTSTPLESFTIEFFASPTSGTAAADSGREGKVYLGSVTTNTLVTGVASFSFAFTPTAANPYITATATDINGNTSEFSPSLDPGLTATGAALTATAAIPFYGTVATFSSVNGAPPSNFTATIQWGDGQTSTGLIVQGPNNTYTVIGGNTYLAPATSLTVTVTIVDAIGNGTVVVDSTMTVFADTSAGQVLQGALKYTVPTLS